MEKGEVIRLLTEVQKMEETLVSVIGEDFLKLKAWVAPGCKLGKCPPQVDKEYSFLSLEVHLGDVFRLLSYPL